MVTKLNYQTFYGTLENNMRFFMAEKEAFDELGASETLGDIIRIGFNRVDFI